jgi:hypothetical protein
MRLMTHPQVTQEGKAMTSALISIGNPQVKAEKS